MGWRLISPFQCYSLGVYEFFTYQYYQLHPMSFISDLIIVAPSQASTGFSSLSIRSCSLPWWHDAMSDRVIGNA